MMNEKELIIARIVELQDEIDSMLEELSDLKAMKREIETAEAEQDNPYWFDDGGDEYGGRLNKQVEEIKEALLNGNRAERVMARRHDVYNCKIVVTMAERDEDVDPYYMALYESEQSEQFAGAIIGSIGTSGYLLDEINEEGGEVDGYFMPWSGNAGPVEARKRFEAWWSDPNRLAHQRRLAERGIRSLDFYYRMAGWRGNQEEFLQEHPYYEPE